MVSQIYPHVSTHSRPKAAGKDGSGKAPRYAVSTHSRPKAAGIPKCWHIKRVKCFNTQPPEGGWQDNIYP